MAIDVERSGLAGSASLAVVLMPLLVVGRRPAAGNIATAATLREPASNVVIGHVIADAISACVPVQ